MGFLLSLLLFLSSISNSACYCSNSNNYLAEDGGDSSGSTTLRTILKDLSTSSLLAPSNPFVRLNCTGSRGSSRPGVEKDWREQILGLAREAATVEWVKGVRRRIHEHPELAYEEVETSTLIREQLDAMGIPYIHPMALTGIVASLGTGRPPVVAIRADMDALPIQVI